VFVFNPYSFTWFFLEIPCGTTVQAGSQSDLVISPQVLQGCAPDGVNGEEG
jgi:hypothetical protein